MQFEIRNAPGQQSYYFRIVASNGKVLASSETYWNKSDVESAINTIKVNAATAKTVDYTKSTSRAYGY